MNGKKDSKDEQTWIAKISPEIRYTLVKQKRIFIGLKSCPVLDRIHIIQCYNCGKYGHFAKNCKPEQPACTHCGEIGHCFKFCPDKNNKNKIKCVNCIRWAQRHNITDPEICHKGTDSNCPTAIKVKEKLIANIDYGKFGFHI